MAAGLPHMSCSSCLQTTLPLLVFLFSGVGITVTKIKEQNYPDRPLLRLMTNSRSQLQKRANNIWESLSAYFSLCHATKLNCCIIFNLLLVVCILLNELCSCIKTTGRETGLTAKCIKARGFTEVGCCLWCML